MTTVTTHGKKYTFYTCNCTREHLTDEKKNKSLLHRCEVQREKGVKIERGLITVGGLGGLSELVDMAASDPDLYCALTLLSVPACFSGGIHRAVRRVERL